MSSDASAASMLLQVLPLRLLPGPPTWLSLLPGVQVKSFLSGEKKRGLADNSNQQVWVRVSVKVRVRVRV